MIDLWMDIILWQIIGVFSEQGLPLLLLLLRHREKKWRKLSKTLFSNLAWVQGTGFTLQKNVEPGFFRCTSSFGHFIYTMSF